MGDGSKKADSKRRAEFLGRATSGGQARPDGPSARLCAWAGMATGMRSAPQFSAKGDLHTSPATGGAMWAASPYSALCTDSTGCQDGSAQAEESVSRCGEGKALRSQLRGGAAMSDGALSLMYTTGRRQADSWRITRGWRRANIRGATCRRMIVIAGSAWGRDASSSRVPPGHGAK
jgi:hypothetical protein